MIEGLIGVLLISALRSSSNQMAPPPGPYSGTSTLALVLPFDLLLFNRQDIQLKHTQKSGNATFRVVWSFVIDRG